MEIRKLFLLKVMQSGKPLKIQDIIQSALGYMNETSSEMFSTYCGFMTDLVMARQIYRVSLGEYAITTEGFRVLEEGKEKAWGLTQALCSEDIDLTTSS